MFNNTYETQNVWIKIGTRDDTIQKVPYFLPFAIIAIEKWGNLSQNFSNATQSVCYISSMIF